MYTRADSIVSTSHIVFAFRFTGSDGTTNDGSENDGEHVAVDCCLNHLHVQCIYNDVKIHWWPFCGGTLT